MEKKVEEKEEKPEEKKVEKVEAISDSSEDDFRDALSDSSESTAQTGAPEIPHTPREIEMVPMTRPPHRTPIPAEEEATPRSESSPVSPKPTIKPSPSTALKKFRRPRDLEKEEEERVARRRRRKRRRRRRREDGEYELAGLFVVDLGQPECVIVAFSCLLNLLCVFAPTMIPKRNPLVQKTDQMPRPTDSSLWLG